MNIGRGIVGLDVGVDVVGLRVEGRRVDGLRVVGLFVVGRAVGVVGPTGSSNVGLRDVGRFVGVDEGLRVVGLIVGVNVGLLLMSPVAVIDMVRFWVGMNIPTTFTPSFITGSEDDATISVAIVLVENTPSASAITNTV
jgi:hypothetical protein